MGRNITDSTCGYGLAQTRAGCVRTLASFDETAYLHAQITYLIVGMVLAAATGFLTLRAYKNECPKLQKHSLLLLFYAAVTFILRGADPESYKHVIPRPIVIFFTDSCTAALYSIYIMSLVYWATIIQQGAAQLQRPLHIRRLERYVIAFVWAFYICVDMCAFAFKGFLTNALQYVQMIGCAVVLFVVSAAFLVYGLRVMSRLRVFEQYMHRVERARSAGYAAFGTVGEQQDLEQHPQAKLKTTNSHTSRIRKILLVVEIFAAIVIAVQLWVGLSRSDGSTAELDCANGLDCSSVSCSVNILVWCQVACIIVIGGIFHNTNRQVDMAPPSSPEE